MLSIDEYIYKQTDKNDIELLRKHGINTYFKMVGYYISKNKIMNLDLYTYLFDRFRTLYTLYPIESKEIINAIYDIDIQGKFKMDEYEKYDIFKNNECLLGAFKMFSKFIEAQTPK